jgi:hypothetical protein
MFVMFLTEISMGGFWQIPRDLSREELRDWLLGRSERDPKYFSPGSSQVEIKAHLKQRFGWRAFWSYEQFYRPFYPRRRMEQPLVRLPGEQAHEVPDEFPSRHISTEA